MIAGIKKCIDDGDIKGLRYIFLDSLDVDPTFEKYKDDYEVCKNVKGVFEPYIELTALLENQTKWDMDYWFELKYDLKQNFSEKRFEHMIEVAKVVYAEKIKRLLAERDARQKSVEENKGQVLLKESILQNNEQQSQTLNMQSIHTTHNSIQSGQSFSEGTISAADNDRINDKKRALELHNKTIEKEEMEKRQKRLEKTKELERKNALIESKKQSKKGLGIVSVVVAIILIVGVVFLLKEL